MSAFNVDKLQFQVDVILMLLIVELIAILIFLFLVRDDGVAVNAVARSKQGRNHDGRCIGGPSRLVVLVSLIRPFMSSIAGALSFVSAWRFAELGGRSLILVVISTTTLCMFGYVVNDILDVHKDTVARRSDKLVALGIISIKRAAALAAALALISLTSAMWVRDDVFMITVMGVLLALGYSHFSRKLPKLKGLYTGVLCCLPIIVVSGGHASTLDVSVLAVIILFVFGREMIIDVTDIEYDKLSHHFTLALWLGADRALSIGWLVMLGSAPVLLAIEVGVIGRLFAGLAVLSLIWILLLGGFRNAERSVSLSRIPMMLTIGSFLFQS
jgi:4-hydroxybenzoate polyprenyltransferase